MKYTDNETVQIVVPPSAFNDVESFVSKELNKRLNQCSKENGYTIKILNFDILPDNYISVLNSHLIVNVSFTFEGFIPRENTEYETVVEYVFSEGVFCKVSGLRILIPYTLLQNKGWSFSNDTMCKDKQVIQKDDTIKVFTKIVKYNKREYQCVADLVEDKK